jgi:hypothetical protein
MSGPEGSGGIDPIGGLLYFLFFGIPAILLVSAVIVFWLLIRAANKRNRGKVNRDKEN